MILNSGICKTFELEYLWSSNIRARMAVLQWYSDYSIYSSDSLEHTGEDESKGEGEGEGEGEGGDEGKGKCKREVRAEEVSTVAVEGHGAWVAS